MSPRPCGLNIVMPSDASYRKLSRVMFAPVVLCAGWLWRMSTTSTQPSFQTNSWSTRRTSKVVASSFSPGRGVHVIQQSLPIRVVVVHSLLEIAAPNRLVRSLRWAFQACVTVRATGKRFSRPSDRAFHQAHFPAPQTGCLCLLDDEETT